MLDIRLLGRFEVRRNGEPVAIPSRAAQSLLAYLLLNPNIDHRRERLAGLLAPDSADEKARATLRHSLWLLRKTLGADPATGREYFAVDDLCVRLDPTASYTLDVDTLLAARPKADLAELTAAVTAYGGELLPGFYEDWVLLERSRLAALFESQVRRLVDGLLAAGRWEEVLTWAERWIAVGEPPEAAYRALMVAHAARGDTGRAAGAYRRCVDALHKELGVEPGEAIRELYEHLAKGEALPELRKRTGVQFAAGGLLLPEGAPQSADAPEPGDPPFKGLKYYDVADASLFFGREALTAQLASRLCERALLIVVGASGSGKSSLLRAGIIPALMAGAISAQDGANAVEDSREWRYHLITPTSHPLQALALSLTRESESVTAAATLTDDMQNDPRSLGLYLARSRLPGSGRDGHHALIAVDQFEELFTQCRDEEERTAFIANLMALIPTSSAPQPAPGTVILALRADFYAHCADHPSLRAALATSQEYIGVMTRDELRRAMERPAEGAGWQFEPGLVDQLLHDAGDEPGALPLVSHALLETWERRRGRTMTFGGYVAAGGVSSAIARTAQTTYSRLTSEQQAVARNIFLRLTELGEGTQDTRRRAAISEFLSDPSSQPMVESVLAILADARLITVSAQQAEVAHEALIREWPLLREWLREDREGLLVHRRLTEAANLWAELERDAGELYRGARLARALEWAQTGHVDLSVLEREFLEAAQAAAEQEAAEKEAQRRRELEAAQRLANEQHRSDKQIRRVAVILAAALVLALALAGLAVMLQNRARAASQLAKNEQARAEEAARLAQNEQTLALSRELAVSAESALPADPQLGLLLALEAAERPAGSGIEAPVEVEAALHRVLQVIQRQATVTSEAGVAISPDASLAATVDEEGSLRVWALSQWAAAAPAGPAILKLAAHPGYHTLAFSVDNARLADGSDDGTLTVWDLKTGQAITTIRGGAGQPIRLVFDLDGKRLAALRVDLTATVWDVDTGKALLQVGPAPGVVVMDLSPDGGSLAMGDPTGLVVVQDIATGQAAFTLADRFANVQEIRFCKANRLGVRTPKVLSFWDLASGQRSAGLRDIKGLVTGSFACDLATDRVAIAGIVPAVRLFDATNASELTTLPDKTVVSDLAFSADGGLLYVHTALESVQVWETYGGGELAAFAAPNGSGAVAISPDGAYVATGIDQKGGLALWRIPSVSGGSGQGTRGGLIGTWPKLHDTAISALEFSPDGSRLASGDSASTVKVTELAAFLSSTGNPAASEALPSPTWWTNYRVMQVAFSRDGAMLAALTPGQLEPYHPLAMWDLPRPGDTRPAAIRTFPVQEPQWARSVAFSPDGKLLALGLRSGHVELRDATSGEPRGTLEGHDWVVTDLAFGSDGSTLALGTVESSLGMWRLAQPGAAGAAGTQLFHMVGHDASISSVAVTPDGKRLISGSIDGTVKVWDASSGLALYTLGQGKAPVTNLSLSADGRRLAVVSDAVRVYALATDDLLALANGRVTRSLSAEERVRYLHEAPASERSVPVASSAAASLPRRPKHIVRAFVNAWNHMDGFGVTTLFAPEFEYSLDTGWGRGEYPLPSAMVLTSEVWSTVEGEGGKFALTSCDPPSWDQTVRCQLRFTSLCYEALGHEPANFDATFSFEDDRISKVVGAPAVGELQAAQQELYTYYLWSIDNARDLWSILNQIDQMPNPTSAEAVLAGEVWRDICIRYAASRH